MQSFIKFLIACVCAEVIHRKAQLSGPEGRAYQEAEKWLISLRHDNVLMTQSCLDKATRIAEENLQLTDSAMPIKTMVSEIVDQNETTEDLKSDVKPEPEKMQKMEDEIKKLKAMVSNFRCG